MMEQIWQIAGMKCDGCVSKVQKALESMAGVREVSVSLKEGSARTRADELLSSDRVGDVVEAAGHFSLRDR